MTRGPLRPGPLAGKEVIWHVKLGPYERALRVARCGSAVNRLLGSSALVELLFWAKRLLRCTGMVVVGGAGVEVGGGGGGKVSC